MNPIQFYRALVILNGAVPLLMLALDAYRGQLGANAVNHALHITGILSLLFLFFSLLVTPLRWLTGWGGWVAFRRSLGLYGFFYAVLHLAIYVGFDRAMNWSSTFHEIWTRRFLQIGMIAVLLMVPLAVTSTNSMIQWMGPKRWKLLHRAAYLVAALGVVHYFLLVKSDIRQPVAFGVVLAVLLVGRFIKHYVELLQGARQQNRNLSAPQSVVRSISASSAAVSSSNVPKKLWKGELRVAAIFQETHDVKTFRLTTPDGSPLAFSYQPGQFLNLSLMIDGKPVNRSYTIASSPTRRDSCELSIKREPQGRGASRFMHDRVCVGDTLKVSAPAGKFVFTGDKPDQVLLIAGGVGITPMMSIVRYLTDRAWSGDIYFLIVARTEQDLIFRDEIEWLRRRFARLHVCSTLTRCAKETTWNGDRGRVNEALLRRFVPDLTSMPIYLCGPNEMMDATRELLIGMNVPSSQIKTEAFAAATTGQTPATEPEEVATEAVSQASTNGTIVSPIANGAATIKFLRSRVEKEFSTQWSVLDAAEASSIDIPTECRSGICGQCKTRLLSGRVRMECEDAMSPAEKAAGVILACQAIPLSDLIVDA